MSLLDLILAQKGILLTAGFALLLLTAAVALTLISRIRKVAAVRAKQKVLRAVQRERERVANSPEPVEQPVASGKPAAESPIIAGPNPVPAAAPAPQAVQATAAPESQPGQPAPDSAPNAMQAILSSVFGDEETTAKYDMLLQDLEPIGIEHLLALSIQTAEQLHGQSGR